MPRQVDLTTAVPGAGSLDLAATHETFLGTVATLVYNITTTPWSSNGYTVLPFWPSVMTLDDFATLNPATATNWRGETTVLSTRYDCKPAKSERGPIVKKDFTSMVNRLAPDYERLDTIFVHGTSKMLTNTLSSDDGCHYDIDSSPTLMVRGSRSINWARTLDPIYEVGMGFVPTQLGSSDPEAWIHVLGNQSTSPPQGNVTQPEYFNLLGEQIGPDGWLIRHNRSGACEYKDVILVESNLTDPSEFSNQDTSGNSNFTQRALICGLEVFMADMPVSITTSGRKFNISLDRDKFQRDKVPLSLPWLNLEDVLRLLHTSDWLPYVESQGLLTGRSAVLLAAQTNGTFDGIIHNEELPEKAERAVQEFLGQLVLSFVTTVGASETKQIPGQMTVMERRITVIDKVGVALAILFGVNIALLSIVLFTCNRNKRPLRLKHNPWTVSGAAELMIRSNWDMGLWKRLCIASHDGKESYAENKAYGKEDIKIEECEISSEFEGSILNLHLFYNIC